MGEIGGPLRRRIALHPGPVADILQDGDHPLTMGAEFVDRAPPDFGGGQGTTLHRLHALADRVGTVVGDVRIGRLEKGVAAAEITRRDQWASGQQILGADEHGPFLRRQAEPATGLANGAGDEAGKDLALPACMGELAHDLGEIGRLLRRVIPIRRRDATPRAN